MKVYCHGFWSGFHERTNAVHELFFIELMKEVYNCDIHITHNINDADILIENTQITHTLRHHKKWVHTYLYSGESYIRADKDEYSCVLYGNRNHKNVVNVPLYVPYYVCSQGEHIITENKKPHITVVPSKDVLVIVSNPGGHVRNQIMEKLEQHFSVTYAGHYKNNTNGAIPYYYNTPEFKTYVSQFKFILSMENSEEDTYITEKIAHGLVAGSIPIYWGSKRVTDYFHSERILEIQQLSEIDAVIQTMKTMTDQEWLRRVNHDPFTEFGRTYTTKTIANHVKNVIFDRPFPNLTALYMICNPDFEPVRYQRLMEMCQALRLKEHHYKFLCPTYKHTITDTDVQKYVTANTVQKVRATPIKKSELSLYLNFKAVWEHIVASYRDGIFLVLEADAFMLPEIRNFNDCLEKLKGKIWSGINISSDGGSTIDFQPSHSFTDGILPYRDYLSSAEKIRLEQNCIEDLSTPQDKDVRFMRKYHTRCTDSQLWSYRGCCQMLEEMRKDPTCNIPLDYYIIQKLESNMSIKYYWSDETYFDQASNRGLERSTIQQDCS
jgi:hypothetical protein